MSGDAVANDQVSNVCCKGVLCGRLQMTPPPLFQHLKMWRKRTCWEIAWYDLVYKSSTHRQRISFVHWPSSSFKHQHWLQCNLANERSDEREFAGGQSCGGSGRCAGPARQGCHQPRGNSGALGSANPWCLFAFGIGGERQSVAPRQVASGASGSAPSQPPHMDAEQDQDWLETQDAG